MSQDSKVYLALILVCLIGQGLFAMMEMACVSFNKMRLQYYLSKGDQRAVWLSYLLQRPALLFGTTLIGLNSMLILGSECARRLYDSMGLSPDLAPLSQIVVVLIFAEIAPLLAARKYAEHVGLLGIPVLFFLSIVFRPFTWALDLLCRGINRLLGLQVIPGHYLSREELQNIIEERDETITSDSERQQMSTIVPNIFAFKNKKAKDLMRPLADIVTAPIFATVGQIRDKIEQEKGVYYVPLYHRLNENITLIAYPRDLLRISEKKRARDYARPAWFITEGTSIFQILKQFRRNNQSLAIVLNQAGLATGVLTLDEIIDELFGCSDEWMSFGEMVPRAFHVVVDRSFPADMLLEEFNTEFQVHLAYRGAKTLEDLMTKALGHPPTKGEMVKIDQFELLVEEASLLGARIIQVRSVF